MTINLDPIISSLSSGEVQQAQKSFNALKEKLPKLLSRAISSIFNSKTEGSQTPLKPQVMARQIRALSNKPTRALETSDRIIHILSYLDPDEISEMGRINRLWNSLTKQALISQLIDPLRVDAIDGEGNRQRNAISTYQIYLYKIAGLSSKKVFEILGNQLRKFALRGPDEVHYLAEMNQVCSNIEYLSFDWYTAHEFPHDKFVESAKNQKSLSSLELSRCALTSQSFATLRNFANLSTLTLVQTFPRFDETRRFTITETDCAVLKEIPYLQSLTLEEFEFNDDLMIHIVACKNLKMLSLSSMRQLTDRSLTILSQAPNLSVLKLMGCHRILGTQLNQGLPKLKALGMCYMQQFSRSGLTSLAQRSTSLIKLIFIQNWSGQPASGQEEAQEMIRSRRESITAKK